MKTFFEALTLTVLVLLLLPIYWLGFAWRSVVLFFLFGSADANQYFDKLAAKGAEKMKRKESERA